MKEKPKEHSNNKPAYTRSGSAASNEDSDQRKSNYEFDNVRVIPPKMPREFIHIVRSENFVNENSIISLTSKLANTVKDAADGTIDSIKQVAGAMLETDGDSKQVILPSTNQEFPKDKNDVHDEVSIEKKWITKKTKIEIPVRYERIFVNGEELRFGVDQAFSEIKDRILDTVSVEHDNKNKSEYNWVPIFGHDTEMQREFPLYAEELIISKRKVMVGKITIRKRQITRKQTKAQNS